MLEMLTLILLSLIFLHSVTFFFFFFYGGGGIGFELRTLLLKSRPFSTWGTSPVHFGLLILEMGPQKLFAQGWPWTTILSNSVSQVARMTGMSHQSLTSLGFFHKAVLIIKPNQTGNQTKNTPKPKPWVNIFKAIHDNSFPHSLCVNV
jgi:hypothetical protein